MSGWVAGEQAEALGILPQSATVAEGSVKYESEVAEAVKRFQLRHALAITGSLGPETVRQLNVPVAERVRQLQFSLERWRCSGFLTISLHP